MTDDDGETWEKHASELIRFATALVGPTDAEDVLSCAFLASVASPGWISVDNKRAYLFRAVTSHAHRQWRSQSRRTAREATVATLNETIGRDPNDLHLVDSLLCLSVRQRAVVWLTYWADLAPLDVAIFLDVSLRTIERELNAARTTLRKALA
jgi:DNA-directed RNA polymerase specialized sigma24 family protein